MPNIVQKTKDQLLQTNLNYQKDLNEVSVIVAQKLAGREKEIGEGMAKIYASEFTEQELKDLVDLLQISAGAETAVGGAEGDSAEHGIHEPVGAGVCRTGQCRIPRRDAQARQANLIVAIQTRSRLTMAEFDVDLFVIGGGSGGVRAARIAAGYGARVVVAEEYRMGGTCVIRGCVPKKLFVIGSHIHQEIEDAAGFGWSIPAVTFDWPTLIANKDKEIARLEGGLHLQCRKVRRAHRQDPRRARGCPHAASRQW